MFSKTKNQPRIDAEQREQYEYARKRIKQKKNLMRHFVMFLVGSILLIIINPILDIRNEFFFDNWFVWAILIWTFIFLVHVLNVFVINKFMGKEWEDAQLQKLKNLQREKLAKMQREVDAELKSPSKDHAQMMDHLEKPLPPQTL